MNLVKNALITTATVVLTAWVVAQLFPNLIGSLLSGATPDVTFKTFGK